MERAGGAPGPVDPGGAVQPSPDTAMTVRDAPHHAAGPVAVRAIGLGVLSLSSARRSGRLVATISIEESRA
jgi:hypothetical protein